MNKSEKLEVSYDDLLAVLKEWDEYTVISLEEMSKGFRVSNFNGEKFFFYSQSFAEEPNLFAKKINLSDMSNLLWESLKLGAKEVERIHDERFLDTQVEYFKDKFRSSETIVENYDYGESGYYHLKSDLGNPMSVFVKLGKPAQLQIIQEGFLQIAITNYEDAKEFIFERDYAEKFVSEEEREATNRIKQENKRIRQVESEVRKLDELKCVFCGKKLDTTAKRNYFCESEDEFITERVFLCCNYCLKESSSKELTAKFGRFVS